MKYGDKNVENIAPMLAPALRILIAMDLFAVFVYLDKTTCEAGKTGAHEIPRNNKLTNK